MIHTFWPKLLQREDFITSLLTPIVKIFNKNDKLKDDPIA